jgi:hypothetical protein
MPVAHQPKKDHATKHDHRVFLDSLADRTPAPGGGATAALHLGQAAALVSMVARYSTGARYAEHAAVIDGICRSSTPTGCQSPPKARQPNVIGSSELRTQTSPDLAVASARDW